MQLQCTGCLHLPRIHAPHVVCIITPNEQLEQDLKAGALKGGDEDSAVVSRVLEVYLKPMQEAMRKVAPMLQIAGRDSRERVRLLPSIMQVCVGGSPNMYKVY